jgi:hypothetical protein
VTRAVVLVEGTSDEIALRTLAERRGRDLDAEGVEIVPIGGAHSLGRFLAAYGDATLAGLYDIGEEEEIRRALRRAGLGNALTRDELESLGFYVCDRDLEDELIRALGAAAVEQLVAAHGDLRPWQTFQKQPEWRGRPVEQQLRRFMGSGGRRKIHYARFLVEALDPARVPRPLDRVLAHV